MSLAEKILKRLRFDNHTIHMVTELVKYHDYNVEPQMGSVRRAIMKMGEDIFLPLLEVKRADLAAQSSYMREEKEARLEALYQVYGQVKAREQCVSLKDLAVTGKDLIKETGMEPGPEMGAMLRRLLDMVVEEPSLNERETLLGKVKEFL